MKLDGKVAIVTGSGRGIVAAIARKLAAEGATITVSALHFETASRVAQEIRDQGGRAIAVKADVSQRAEVQDLVEKTLETFGNIRILVNNAGGMGPGPIPILEITDEDWYGILNSNLTSVFLCTQAVLGHMIKR